MPEWLIEHGIGETRSVLVDRGEIVESRIELEGVVPSGTVLRARLTDIGRNGRNAVAVDELGSEYLLPRGAPGVSQGGAITIEVTRARIAGGEAWKRAIARLSDGAAQPAAPLHGREVAFPSPRDALGQAGWGDLLEEARTGIVRFAGGELRISPTPAMTLIDVDGFMPPAELAAAGAAAAARAVRRLDIGGSIGIDLPTAGSKASRQAAAAAIDHALPQPFERTAVNGFGFVQIVRPRLRASLVELAQDRGGFEARALVRAAALGLPGGRRLVAHPQVIAAIESAGDWLDRLSRQIGGTVALRGDPSLPMSGGYAEPL